MSEQHHDHAQQQDPTAPEPAGARRQEREGWLLLTAIFVGGAVLVVLAAMFL